MRNTVLKLARSAPPPSDRDPLREELRKAIDAHAQAKRERDRIVSAHEVAERRSWEVSSEVEQLSGQIAEMIDNRAQRAAQRALDGSDLADNDLKAAQRRLEEAEDVLSAARSAYQVLETSVQTAESVLQSASSRVEKAAGAVLVAQAPALEKRARELLAELSPILTALTYIDSRDQSWPSEEERRSRERLLRNPFGAIPAWGKSINSPEVADIVDPWKQAFNALMADAGAPLPEVPA